MLAFTDHDSDSTALNRRESLLHYLEHPLVPPEPLGTNPTAAERAAYNAQRMDYLSGGIVLTTKTVIEGRLLLTNAFQENRARNSGHAGVMLSGDSSLGKTTTAKRLMRWVLGEYAKQFPHWRAMEHVPVMYVEVGSNSTGKALLKEMADFFGLAVRDRDSMADLRSKVVNAIRRAHTQLIVVDELHNLTAGHAVGLGETVDLLKGLHNDIAATFLYCGIDVTDSSLMNGARGQQLKRRFSVLELTRYEWSNTEHRKEWKSLIKSFEDQLQLRDHPVGMYKQEAEHFWQRTGGSIGSLSKLLTGPAINLIQNGAPVEMLDRSVLDRYKLDLAAENHYKGFRDLKANAGKTAMERALS